MDQEQPKATIPILDNHVHLDPRGLKDENARRFSKAGGTHLVVIHKPYRDRNLVEARNYEKAFDLTLSLADECRKTSPELKIFVVLGPYPVDLLRLAEHMTLQEAKDILLKGMDLARKHVEEGRAIALGEIGRPHFNVEPEVWQLSNEIMQYGMSAAKDAGCPVVLHTESAGNEVWHELAEMADKAGLAREKVIKHFAPPVVNETDNCGLFPSVLASKNNIKEAIVSSDRFMMETDYLDDPARPGAVLGIATVPKVTQMLLRNELATEEQLIQIHQKNPEKVYGIDFE